MQCQLRSMSDVDAPPSDTLPKRGRVNEVCREWLVHEDGALAYQLQKQEVERHLTGNKSRNAIVREDFPRAKDEQKREELEALAQYHAEIHRQEAKDARIAQQLAEEMAKEEEKQRRLEAEDQRIARQIQQEKEAWRQSRSAYPVGDVNSVGLPSPNEILTERSRRADLPQQLRMMTLESSSSWDEDSLPSPTWPPPPSGLELDLASRTEQERKDEELARQLQEEEENGIDIISRDRLMAIEAQDKELAKILQKKERLRAKKAHERAKAKAFAKKQMEEGLLRDGVIGCEEMLQNSARGKPKHRLGDGDEIEVLTPIVSPSGCTIPNIAMAIDPTYTPPRSTTSTLASTSSYHDYEDEDESPAPPYMPVQGQRRSSSLDKKRKKDRSKDGCKQQ